MLCAMSKLRVGVLFGGRSTEHEVSVVSATTIAQALDPSHYTPVLIGIDHDGGWHVAEPELELLPQAVIEHPRTARARPLLGNGLELVDASGARVLAAPLDVVFPIVHGRGGEDGSLQGLLELAGVPYVGAGVLATALCMDKAQSKAVLRDAGLPVVPCLTVAGAQVQRDPGPFSARVARELGFPVFAKPVNTGSSVGVSKARTRAQLEAALKEAARYDADVLVEPGVEAREIECAMLGGRDPQASVLGEITYTNEFYDYEAKYASDQTQLIIPAQLPHRLGEELRAAAVRAFVATGCWGMARVDFFVTRDGSYFVNELNTLPGFTDGSMYPRLWDASGIALPELIGRLLELALERQRERAALEIRFRR
jgi:D-alanine-D-alanine ligase